MNDYSYSDVGITVGATLTDGWMRVVNYFPQFIGGLLILLIGIIVASVLKAIVKKAFKLLRVEEWFGESKVDSVVGLHVWPGILAEVVRWSVIILFLIPAAEAWGLPRITEVLNKLLLYIPNIFVAVVVGFVGFAIANQVSRVVRNATAGLGDSSSVLLSHIAKYAMIFFTSLVVLNQLGVAADLVRILFTGMVAMLALAGGLAFGLGGQETAKELLSEFRRKVRK